MASDGKRPASSSPPPPPPHHASRCALRSFPSFTWVQARRCAVRPEVPSSTLRGRRHVSLRRRGQFSRRVVVSDGRGGGRGALRARGVSFPGPSARRDDALPHLLTPHPARADAFMYGRCAPPSISRAPSEPTPSMRFVLAVVHRAHGRRCALYHLRRSRPRPVLRPALYAPVRAYTYVQTSPAARPRPRTYHAWRPARSVRPGLRMRMRTPRPVL